MSLYPTLSPIQTITYVWLMGLPSKWGTVLKHLKLGQQKRLDSRLLTRAHKNDNRADLTINS